MEALHARGLSWSYLAITTLALLALLLLRKRAQARARRWGLAPIAALILSFGFRIGATSFRLVDDGSSAAVLDLLASLGLAFGLTQLVGTLVFDLGLGRLGVELPKVLRDVLLAIVFLASVLGVLRTSGVNLVSLVTTSAVLTAVIGLALQDTIANLFSGIALQVDHTVEAGDWIQLGDRVGCVQAIQWRSTTVVTRDQVMLILPNASLLRGEVVNHSRPTTTRRVWCRVGFHYRHPPNEVKRVLLSAAEGLERVRTQPPPDVLATDFGDSAVSYALRIWIDDFLHEDEILSELRTRIWYGAERAGLEIPFPIRTLHVPSDPGAGPRVSPEQRGARGRALAKLELFAQLSGPALEGLVADTTPLRFAAGERILTQGASGDSLYVVESGSVSVRIALDGAEREVATLGPGEFFGEMSLLSGEPRAATVVARTDASCLVVGHEAFQNLLDARPELAEHFAAVLARRHTALEAERQGLGAEAAARSAAEVRSKFLDRLGTFFRL